MLYCVTKVKEKAWRRGDKESGVKMSGKEREKREIINIKATTPSDHLYPPGLYCLVYILLYQNVWPCESRWELVRACVSLWAGALRPLS